MVILLCLEVKILGVAKSATRCARVRNNAIQYRKVQNSAMQYGKYKKCEGKLTVTNIDNNY